MATNSKQADGSTNYAVSVVNNASNYVWMAGFETVFTNVGAGTTADNADDFILSTPEVKTYQMVTGTNSAALTPATVATGFDLYEDQDTVEVDFLIAPSMGSRSDQTTVVNDLAATAIARKDCVAVASPARSDVVGVADAATITTNIETTADTFTATSYLVADANFLKVYDKYNDKYIHIPAA